MREKKGEEVSELTRTIILAAAVLCLAAGGAGAETYGLKDLFQRALQQAERIRIAEENVALAAAGKDKKRSLLMPRLTAYGNYADFTEKKYAPDTKVGAFTIPGTLIQPDNAAAWGVRLDQSLTIDGREIRDFLLAKENVDKTRTDLSTQKEEYLTAVAMAYYDTLRAGKLLDVAEANLRRLEVYRDAALKRLKVGEVTRTVLLRADGELSGARSERIRAKNALELSRAYLARLVGIGEGFDLREEMKEDRPGVPLETYVQTAMANRTEVASLELEVKMAGDAVRVAQGGYWPVLSVSGVYGRADQDPYSGTLNRESVYAQAALNFPFFEGGLRAAEVREARIREKQARLRLEDLKKTVRIEVETAYTELENQRAVIKALEDQVAFARDNYRDVSRQFEFGLANGIDVMDANTLLLSAERQLTAACYSRQISIMRLKRATGTLLKEAGL